MKQRLLLIALCLMSVPLYAVIEVGDRVPNQCWTTVEGSQFCLNEAKDQVRVLLFNSGWCGPCNAEFDELSGQTSQYHGKAVTFISLSADGWEHGSMPDATFLSEWKDKHHLDFVVAASPHHDAGKAFFEPPIYIPNVAIVGKDGKLFFKGVNPGVDAMLEEVNQALNDKR